MRVSDLPIAPLLGIEPDASLADVARRMRVEDCDSVAVMEDGRMIGIVTERDLIRAVADGVDPRRARAALFMSPDPVTVNLPPAWWYPPGMAGEASPGPAPSWVPVQAPGAAPRRLTWSRTAVARVGPPVPLLPSRPWAVVTVKAGEVENRPACTVAGRPGRVAVPTCAQCAPSADSYPVTVSPALVSRSQRGDAGVGRPGGPAASWV